MAQKMKNHGSKFSWLAISNDVRVVCNVCICVMDRIPFYSLEGSRHMLDKILPHKDFTVLIETDENLCNTGYINM